MDQPLRTPFLTRLAVRGGPPRIGLLVSASYRPLIDLLLSASSSATCQDSTNRTWSSASSQPPPPSNPPTPNYPECRKRAHAPRHVPGNVCVPVSRSRVDNYNSSRSYRFGRMSRGADKPVTMHGILHPRFSRLLVVRSKMNHFGVLIRPSTTPATHRAAGIIILRATRTSHSRREPQCTSTMQTTKVS